MPSHRFTAEECKQTGIWAMTPEERRAAQSRGGKTSQAKIRRPEITARISFTHLIDLVICPPVSIHAIGRQNGGQQSIPTWSIKNWLYSTVILIGGQMTRSK